MREITIQRGAWVMRVHWIDQSCPVCLTLVRAGEEHCCQLVTTLDAVGATGGKATVEVRQPQKVTK